MNENENCDGKRNKYSVCQIKNGGEETCKRETRAYIENYNGTKVEQKRKRERKEERKIEGTKRRIKNKAETIKKIRQVLEEHRNRNALRKKTRKEKREGIQNLYRKCKIERKQKQKTKKIEKNREDTYKRQKSRSRDK